MFILVYEFLAIINRLWDVSAPHLKILGCLYKVSLNKYHNSRHRSQGQLALGSPRGGLPHITLRSNGRKVWCLLHWWTCSGHPGTRKRDMHGSPICLAQNRGNQRHVPGWPSQRDGSRLTQRTVSSGSWKEIDWSPSNGKMRKRKGIGHCALIAIMCVTSRRRKARRYGWYNGKRPISRTITQESTFSGRPFFLHSYQSTHP